MFVLFCCFLVGFVLGTVGGGGEDSERRRGEGGSMQLGQMVNQRNLNHVINIDLSICTCADIHV